MDIVERLKFDAARCEATFSKGVAGNIEEAAAEIERLRGVLMGVMAWIDPANETEVSASEVFAKLRADLVANEQSEPPLVHVGRDGQPHNGPRAACTICFMWDQIASNEQNGD